MKKFISLISTITLVASTFVAPIAKASSFSDVSNDDSRQVAITRLSELGVVSGDGDGMFHPDDHVTRAEFTKMVVCMIDAKDEALATGYVSAYADVPQGEWYIPYINYASKFGVITGYANGMFGPDNEINYAEASTILLRVLGYSESDLGSFWPNNYVNKANSIPLAGSAVGDTYAVLTRGTTAVMMYTALLTEVNPNATTKTSTTSSQNYSSNQSSSDGQTQTSSTLTTTSTTSSLGISYQKGKTLLECLGYTITLADKGAKYSSSNAFDIYSVYYVLDDAVVCYNNGSMTELTIPDNTDCYKDKSTQASTFSNVKGDLEMGDVLYIKRDGNDIDYITYTKGNLQGPIQVAQDGSTAGFDTNSSTTFMRDGLESNASEIKANDIIYYSDAMNMVFAYSKKITGVYEAATPSKDTPTSVTISGTTYSIEGVNAFNKLSSSGPFKIGDTITICLGKDGKKVAGVVTDSTSATLTTTIGFAVSSGQKQFTKADGVSYTSYYVTVAKTDGTTQDFPVSTNPQTYYVGKVVKATQSNGDIAEVTSLNESGTVSGVVDSNQLKIGAYNIAEDCEILDTAKMQYLDTSIGRNTYASSYRRIYLQRLDGTTISSSKVLYYTTDSYGKINKMILDNVSGDAYQYGIIISKKINASYYDDDGNSSTDPKKSTSVAALSIYENGSISTYSTYSSSISALHQPIAFISSENVVYGVSALKQYTNIKSLTTSAAVSSTGTQYKLSDKVVCYEQIADDSYVQVTVNDIINGSYKTIQAYYDKAESDGGRVRIIIVK